MSRNPFWEKGDSWAGKVMGRSSCHVKWEARSFRVLHPHPHRSPEEGHRGRQAQARRPAAILGLESHVGSQAAPRDGANCPPDPWPLMTGCWGCPYGDKDHVTRARPRGGPLCRSRIHGKGPAWSHGKFLLWPPWFPEKTLF